MWVGPKNIFEPDPNPKRSQQCKKVLKFSQIKKKDRAILPKPKLIDFIVSFQKLFLNMILTPKISPKGPKNSAKGPKKVQEAPNVAK